MAHPSERSWSILEVLRSAAAELERSATDVALAWVFHQPGVTSTLLGATRLTQFEANVRALELELPAALQARLDEASRLETVHPYMCFGAVLPGHDRRRHPGAELGRLTSALSALSSLHPPALARQLKMISYDMREPGVGPMGTTNSSCSPSWGWLSR